MSGKNILRFGNGRVAEQRSVKFESGARQLFGLAVAALMWAVVAPSSADVLVMKDGSSIDTRGPWQIEGRQVRFELANGTLSAVRLSEVDLEGSRAATEAAAAPIEQSSPAAATKRSVLTLTNESLGLGPEGVIPEEEEDAGGAAEPGVMPDGEVQVGSWDYAPGTEEEDIYEVVGEIVNRGKFRATKLQVYMDIVAVDPTTQEPEPARHLLRPAKLEERELDPGTSTSFRYAISARDLRIFGERGFENPAVSFDIQFVREEVESGQEQAEEEPIGTLSETVSTSEEAG